MIQLIPNYQVIRLTLFLPTNEAELDPASVSYKQAVPCKRISRRIVATRSSLMTRQSMIVLYLMT